ncbi:MAG: DNA-protecting protein DprA [Candidatus Pacebacteria bacterium]|nr:DNA-protecting protein DprA [Candidatus Paceibacterota bacterium]
MSQKIPSLLKEIPDYPEKLYMRGKLPGEKTVISITGSKEPTDYGIEIVKKLTLGLSKYPISIATGLSVGIEQLTTEEALKLGTQVIGISSSGLKHSDELQERIISSNGLLLSEEGPNKCKTKKSKELSLRIIAGISQTTIVIEAERKSNAMVIADLAMQYNREVCTFPGSIFSKTSSGPHYLIRNGATPITSLDNLLEILGFSVERNDKPDLTEEELVAVKVLLRKPLEKIDLCNELNLNSIECDRLIATLSLKDIIKEELGEIKINLPK